nr:transmembrane and coiled-coil domains protein 1 [Microcebus murinus]
MLQPNCFVRAALSLPARRPVPADLIPGDDLCPDPGERPGAPDLEHSSSSSSSSSSSLTSMEPSLSSEETIKRLEVRSLTLAASTEIERLEAAASSAPPEALAHVQQKILRLTEQLRVAQAARDADVAEYLRLAGGAERQQAARVKQAFEKKNQRSAQGIARLQRKLERCRRRLREAQGHQPPHPASSQPPGHPPASSSCCSSSSSAAPDMHNPGWDALAPEVREIREAQARLDEAFEALKEQYQRDYALVMQTLQEERYRCERLEEQLNDLTELHQNEILNLKQELASMEEKIAYQSYERHQESRPQSPLTLRRPARRCERLEEQLNDLTELHQNEILNLKQELASMEEKIAYQSYERARDIQEALEACQTRISKMELQQQQQQVVQLEGLESATARNLLGKLINILLAVMAVLLVFVSTVANCVVPLMKTRSRTCSTLALVLLLALLWKHWDALSGHVERFFSSPR